MPILFSNNVLIWADTRQIDNPIIENKRNLLEFSSFKANKIGIIGNTMHKYIINSFISLI